MNQLTRANSSVDLCDLAYLLVGARAQNASYGGSGTARPLNANKETGIPRDGRTSPNYLNTRFEVCSYPFLLLAGRFLIIRALCLWPADMLLLPPDSFR